LTYQHYDGIAFLGLDETWMVGSSDQWGGQVFDAFPMGLHCIGTTCTSITPAYAGTKTQLVAVAAPANNDVWAVGAVGLFPTTSLIEHWNGIAWSIVSHPNVGSLRDVTAAATDDIWAVGPTAVLHYDGTSWQIASTPAGAVAIDSRGKYNVWAVDNVVQHYPDMPIFNDVTPDNPFYRNIQELACRNIISGYPDGSFRPNNFVSRGQQSKIVSNSAGFNEPVSGQTFQDVAPGSTFYDFIQRLANRGYVNGYPCGSAGEPCVPPGNLPYFRPNAQVTRGQISKIVSNAAGYSDPPGAQLFEDVAPGSTFYDYIWRLADRGAIIGYSCGGPGEPCVPPENRPYFRQNANATRGQTSKIVTRTFFPGCCLAAEK
jgi:hypothetical protein